MFEINIALRNIKARRRQTTFSVIAVALSVAIIIVSMSMLTGFRENIIETTIENQAHIMVLPKENEDYISLYYGLEGFIREQEGVAAVSSYYKGNAAIQYRHNVEGAVLSGVRPVDEDRVLNVKKDMIAGEFESITRSGNRIILGSKLADKLEVGMDDTVTVSFPGSKPSDFKITGIIQRGTSADETLAYANLEQVQDFYGKSGIVTGIGIRVSDVYAVEPLADRIELETGYDAESWMEQSSEILNLLDTQKQFVFIFYLMIFAISGFSIANILTMIVMEKVGEIGMLLAMGTSRKSILGIFLLEAGILGIIGVIIGTVLGYVSCILLISYTIPVPPEMYFGLDHLPIRIAPKNFLTAGTFSMIINILAGINPARRASKMDPVEAIHSV
ncbi:MAG: ABC transporter permease [Methanosarcinales archaeon]|nr:MAG: ABC transporter permease [Methanosarcinales archaeon]